MSNKQPKQLSGTQVDRLAVIALKYVEETMGTYVCQCLYVNYVLSELLKRAGVQNRLTSGRLAGGFNTGDNDSFRYGYTVTQDSLKIDHHVWCETDSGQVIDSMLLGLEEELKLTGTSPHGEYLLPKSATIDAEFIRSYSDIMDECITGLFYEAVESFDEITDLHLKSFVQQHSMRIRSITLDI